MACFPLVETIGNRRRIGFVCTDAICHHLGPGIYISWSFQIGPSFYSDKACHKPVEGWWKKPEIVQALQKWQKSHLIP